MSESAITQATPRDVERDAMERRLNEITLREIFAGARRLAAPKWRREANWVFAMDLFAFGSTYAWAVYERMGIDPDATTVTPRPEANRG